MEEFDDVIEESSTGFTSAARVLLGLFLLGLGVATFFGPEFRTAFIGQLKAARMPFAELSLSMIPIIEGVAGVLLIGGFWVRLASLVGIVVCGFLTYVHLAVTSPTLLPLQFGLPLIPIVALILAGFLYVVEQYDED